MIIPFVLLLSLVGIMFNLTMAGLWQQPDWSAALLFGSMLARRGNWVWAAPALWVHDVTLHWSLLVCFPIGLLLPLLLAHTDMRIGPGLPQRLVLLLLATLSLPLAGWSAAAWLMTLPLSICAWYLMAGYYAKSA